MTTRRTFAFLNGPQPLRSPTRRCGAGRTREHPLGISEHARSLGFGYIETDIRTTRDGEPLIFHDASLTRLAEQNVRLEQLTLDEVRRVQRRSPELFPSLEAALTEFPDLRFNVDMKDEPSIDAAARVIGKCGALDRVCLTSFSASRIRRIRRLLGPDLCTGLGVRSAAVLKLASTVSFGWADLTRSAGCVQLPIRSRGLTVITPRFVSFAQEQGLAVHVWTLNDQGSIDTMLDLNIDGIMTDDPELLRERLRIRGLWKEL